MLCLCYGYFRFISTSAALFIAPWFDTSESMLHLISHMHALRLLFPRLSISLTLFSTSESHHPLFPAMFVCHGAFCLPSHLHSYTDTRRSHCVPQVKRKFSVFISISTMPHIRRSRRRRGRRGLVFIFR